jgi:hypothetical protein
MRRWSWTLLLLAAMNMGGCLQSCGIECENECFIGDHRCNGDLVESCFFDVILTGCFFWVTDEDCGRLGATCLDASCVCPAGAVMCDRCADLSSDVHNCGRCGMACGNGACSGGTCFCNEVDESVRACGGTPACVDLSVDPAHCGSCEVACAAKQACVDGVCR